MTAAIAFPRNTASTFLTHLFGMAGLIGDLLDAGLIGAGMLSVDPAPEELAGIVERARTAFEAGGGSHAVTIDLPEDLPRVMADARRIAQVLGNLFANAARHSPESAPIRVEARRGGGRGLGRRPGRRHPGGAAAAPVPPACRRRRGRGGRRARG